MYKRQFFLILLVLIFGVPNGSAQAPQKLIGFGVINDKAVNLPDPPYPAAARAVGAGGLVNVQVVIDEEGNVISAEAISGHPLLRTASVQAARDAKFPPTLLSGNPVKVEGTIVYNFRLQVAASSGQPDNYAGKTISGGVVNGKAISLPVPQFPAAAKAIGASGEVNIQVLIDEEGNVVSADAVSGHPLLRAAAAQAARSAKFRPTMLSGNPVKVSGVITYNFNLPESAPDYEFALKYMGLGAFLTISEKIPPEAWEGFEKDEFEATPELAADLEPLLLITNQTSLENRIGITRRVSASVERKVKGDDAWQFKLGKVFGETMVELKAFVESEPDQAVIKGKLAEMRTMLENAPADFPPEIRRRFNEIAGYAEVSDFYAEENLTPLIELILETLDIISPDKP